jgi:hypothetical protein
MNASRPIVGSLLAVVALLATEGGCRNVGADGSPGDSGPDTDADSDTDSGQVDCDEIPDFCCAEGCPCAGADESCVFPEPSGDVGDDVGVCKSPPGSGACWSNADCGAGAYCAGEYACPCFMDCYDEWTGICIGISAGCCDNDAGGLCEQEQICVELGEHTDTCHPLLGYPLCWTDTECQNGPCASAILCSCDEDDCESVPGLCADEN